jgi:alpha-mannosidase
MKYETSFDSSHISVTVTLDRNSTALNYAVDCDWREFGGDASGVPALRFCLPLNYNCENYKYDVPFGIADRLPVDMDLPANSCALGNSEHGLKSWILMTKSKYGFRCLDNQIALTLIRGAYDPDPTPEIGMHHIEFAVDSVDYDRGNHYFIAHSYDYNHPIIAMPGTAHHGALAVSKSMFALKSGTAAISCIKTPEKEGKGKVLIRLYETDGNSTNVCLQVGFKTKSACFVDLTERKISEPMSIDGQEISFDLKPYQSASLLIEI